MLIALAVVMVAAAGLLRRPWGIGLGSVLQVLFLLSGLWLLPLLIVAALFAAVLGPAALAAPRAARNPGRMAAAALVTASIGTVNCCNTASDLTPFAHLSRA